MLADESTMRGMWTFWLWLTQPREMVRWQLWMLSVYAVCAVSAALVGLATLVTATDSLQVTFGVGLIVLAVVIESRVGRVVLGRRRSSQRPATQPRD